MPDATRSVLVTGAGRGYGARIAARFAEQGHRVAVGDIVEERAAKVVSQIVQAGGKAFAAIGDVSDAKSVEAMVGRIAKAQGAVEVLVNCAGAYVDYKLPHETTPEEWDLVVNSNLKSCFLTAKYCLPAMMEKKHGRIINFASNAARSTATALGVEYTAAKTGVLGLTRHLAREYAKYAILVNTLCPGPGENERVYESTSSEFLGRIKASIPLGRLAELDEMANVVLFLASDQASYITGATIDVNGGIIMV
jgi:NAD(P)-dependent dehydrogenase (short-subunit alcohol dehydrogenase family)